MIRPKASKLYSRSGAVTASALALLGVAGCALIASFPEPPDTASAQSGAGGIGTTAVTVATSIATGGGAGQASSSGAGGSSAYRDAVLADNPVAYLRLGEMQGVSAAADQVNGGLTGLYQGAYTLGAKGALVGDANTALSLAGQGSVSLGDSFAFDGATAFSLELFYRSDDPLAAGSLISKLYFDGASMDLHGYKLFLWSDVIRVERWNGAGMIGYVMSSKPQSPPGAFTHVVLASGATSMALFVDGVQTDARSLVVDVPKTSAPFVLGGDTFVGTIDEVAVYDKALTQQQVTAHYFASMH